LANGYKAGYPKVSLSRRGIIADVLIHRMVAEAFIPNPLNKPQINHIDGNRENNLVQNLEWSTARENRHHAINVLRKTIGEDHWHSRLMVRDVIEIRAALARGERVALIAKKFNIDGRAIYAIRKGETWAHVA